MNCIAAYDFGTSGVKAALIDDDGKILAVREKGYPLLKPQPLYVEQRPDDFWNAVCEVTRGVVKRADVSPDTVKGLSFSVQSFTMIPVDKYGNVLHNAISWLDGRAEKQAQEINERCGAELVRSQDYQSRILWIKQNMPELYERTKYFLDCDGFLQFKATGVMAVPKDHPGVITYHPDIEAYYAATLADVDRSKLAPMVEACCEYGRLDEKGAKDLGLVPGIPVFGGMIDVPAAAAGCGCGKAGDAHLYLGSSGWLSVLIDHPYATSEGSYQIKSIDPKLLIYGGCTNSCCLMFNWAIDQLYHKEHAELGDRIFDLIGQEVDSVPPKLDDPYATPWLFGEQFPIADVYIRSLFFNISERHTRAHLIRAVMECLCFSMKWQMEQYAKDTGKDIKEIGVNGGGSLSPQWMGMMADILQMPVYVPEESRHSGAIGAAFAAAVGLGWCRFEDVKRFIKVDKWYQPHPELADMYALRYERFKKIYETVKDLYREINGDLVG